MRRKEQEARIEQQKQEKEKAREDAARERARCVFPNPFNSVRRVDDLITTTTFDNCDTCISLYSCCISVFYFLDL